MPKLALLQAHRAAEPTRLARQQGGGWRLPKPGTNGGRSARKQSAKSRSVYKPRHPQHQAAADAAARAEVEAREKRPNDRARRVVEDEGPPEKPNATSATPIAKRGSGNSRLYDDRRREGTRCGGTGGRPDVCPTTGRRTRTSRSDDWSGRWLPVPSDAKSAEVRVRPRLRQQTISTSTATLFSRAIFKQNRAAPLAGWRGLGRGIRDSVHCPCRDGFEFV